MRTPPTRPTAIRASGCEHPRVAVGILTGLLAAATVATSAPASAAAPNEFKSPTGNIFCLYTSGGQQLLRCDIGEFSYGPPDPAEHCGVVFGHTIEMAAGNAPAFACDHDTMLDDQNVAVLGYGQSIQLGPFTCDSSERGVHCVDHTGGHVFTLSRDLYGLS